MNGNDNWTGSREHPFRSISRAAALAVPGTVITVHEGEYREWVKPACGGTGEVNRIVYRAADGERVVIKGSERITNWDQVEGTVWRAVLPNAMFGAYNPYREYLEGDWFDFPKQTLHTGGVYLNGKAFYEAKTLAEVKSPKKQELQQTNNNDPMLHPEDTVYQWYTEGNEDNTVIYANFHGADPNKELTEINVRRSCFFPEKVGLNYITVRGFEMAHAACGWAPPTADQPALLGANWSKGWIIENNVIHDAKCSGISIGKEESTGQNLSTRINDKPGYQYQWETVCLGLQRGWSRELTGSHIIRGNEIYDCGQTGIVGHMGCVFSQIYDNHIYNIAVKHEFFGQEIAGIKLHAPIDVQIHHNCIHNCSLGTWLDWQAQGTRVSNNLYYANEKDLKIEVTHGPCLVDNNIFASDYSIDNWAQGTAYVQNLFGGVMHKKEVLNRATPYHFSHTTQIAGAAMVYGGDDRIYQNIFLGGTKLPNNAASNTCFSGTAGYEGCPESMEEYLALIEASPYVNFERYLYTKQPAYINGNVYLKGASAFGKEKKKFASEKDPGMRIVIKEDGVYLEIHVEDGLFNMDTEIIDTVKLGAVRIVGEAYVTPEGADIVLDTDYNGNTRGKHPVPGPLENLTEGYNCVKVWG